MLPIVGYLLKPIKTKQERTAFANKTESGVKLSPVPMDVLGEAGRQAVTLFAEVEDEAD